MEIFISVWLALWLLSCIIFKTRLGDTSDEHIKKAMKTEWQKLFMRFWPLALLLVWPWFIWMMLS